MHAATLVTAGIYLLLRSSPILEYSSTALLVITLIGASTAFVAATSGLVQNDLKRIIAMSTISQLGYFFLGLIIVYYFYNIFNYNTTIIINLLPFFIPKRSFNLIFSILPCRYNIRYISKTFTLRGRRPQSKNLLVSITPTLPFSDKEGG